MKTETEIRIEQDEILRHPPQSLAAWRRGYLAALGWVLEAEPT